MTLYRNLGGGAFVDASTAKGLTTPTRQSLGFGVVAFLDADDDGHLDLAAANGHIQRPRAEAPWKVPARSCSAGRAGGSPTRAAGPGRHGWYPDLLEGWPSVISTTTGESTCSSLRRTLRSPTSPTITPGGRSVTLRLVGQAPGSNRDAIGAHVTVVGTRASARSTVPRPAAELSVGLGAPAPFRARRRSADPVGRGNVAVRADRPVRRPGLRRRIRPDGGPLRPGPAPRFPGSGLRPA